MIALDIVTDASEGFGDANDDALDVAVVVAGERSSSTASMRAGRKSKLPVTSPFGGRPTLAAMEQAFRKTSGPLTAEPTLRKTPPSVIRSTSAQKTRKSRPEQPPLAAGSQEGN
jgi:hypothetical protein